MTREREQASFVLKLYYPTQTPDIDVRITKIKYHLGGKNLNKQQHYFYLNIENIWENGTMAVVGNVTHRHDVVIDKKSTLFGRLFLNLFCLIKSYSQSK